MTTTTLRKPASFRLRAALLEHLKAAAKATNRSLNNYVETLLENSVNLPNDETIAAIEEAKAKKHAGILDTSSVEAFIKSCE